jgi:hypothetical protein
MQQPQFLTMGANQRGTFFPHFPQIWTSLVQANFSAKESARSSSLNWQNHPGPHKK